MVVVEKEKHLENQVLYITNPAYDALNSENLLVKNDEGHLREHMEQTDIEK